MSFEDSDIYQAILDGDLAALGCSVNEQDVNLRDSSGKSYLHICIELGQQDLVEFLAQKVFLGFRDDNGYTPLDLAVRYRMPEVERQLIRRVAGMQDSDDTLGLHQLFMVGWRAWPPVETDSQQGPLSPGHQCQLEILRLQKHVDHIHWAVQHGELEELQEVLSHDHSLVLVADHTGLPPLQKAVIFEWLSLVQYLSHTFPHAVNHPDHMGRTALHYAAAYHEYQDNILYKQLLRDGGNQHLADLVGMIPLDIVYDARLLNIDHTREHVLHRLSRPSKDYSSQTSFEESRSLPAGHVSDTTLVNKNIKRWKIIASMTSFAKTSHRKITRYASFEETELYEAIITNDIGHTRHVLYQGEDDIHQRSLEGWSYLHLAVAHHASPAIVSLLLMQLSPAVWDCEGLSPLDLCLKQGNMALVRVFVHVVIGLILSDDLDAVQGLMQDGWHYWPEEAYLTSVLMPLITPHMTHFLLSVNEFMSSVREVHKAALHHKELDASLSSLLDTEVAVICLDCVGLSLPHVCVIFYNIHLLSHLLHLFPFITNLKDSVGRTPLHYAAGLDDNDYMYSLLRNAHARDDEEDLWGMRPGDYRSDKQRIVSPRIQETIRNWLYNPHSLVPPWPSCLLSVRMENSLLYAAIKANDASTVDSLLSDPSTDITMRDMDGQSYLHHAVLMEADMPILGALLERVDFTARNIHGNTVLDLIDAQPDPEAKRQTVWQKVKDLILGAGEKGDTEAKRLVLAGWSCWPVTVEEAKEKSDEAAELLEKITALKESADMVHKAVGERRVEDLKQLLETDKSLAEAADSTGLLPLHKAVLLQQVDLVQLLITEFKDTLNAKDYMGRTALHYAAAMKGDDALYNLLKDAGAAEDVTDLAGKTPADYQQDQESLSITDLITKLEKAVDTPVQATSNTESGAEAETETDAPQTQTQTQCTPPPPRQPTPPAPEPPKLAQVVPVNMYISRPDTQRLPPPSTVDGKYVAEHLGAALTMALAEIADKRPWDPIEYLGQWLYKHRQTLDKVAQQKSLLDDIRSEEEEANKEEVIKMKRKEEQLRIQEDEQRKQQEEEEARKKKEQEELQRQAREAVLSQKPQLPTVTEEEDEDPTFRKRDENGQTELHILAAQSGADLVALINLGYSLADRDANNNTPRDIAEQKELTENVEAIDNYVSNLLEQENLAALKQLIVDGYDKLDAVLRQVSTDGLPESVTDFVNSIPDQQKQVSTVLKAACSNQLSDLEGMLNNSLALAKDEHGRSPLHLAILAGHSDIAQHIIQHFPLSVKTRDNLNRTPLHYAAALSEEMTDLLKANGADADTKDAKQHNAAHYEAEKDDILALKNTLLSQGSSEENSAAAAAADAEGDAQTVKPEGDNAVEEADANKETAEDGDDHDKEQATAE